VPEVLDGEASAVAARPGARLRRALALWRLEGPAAAVPEATKAEASDEAYVHAAAVLLLAACDAADERRDDAAARLGVLAGHDPRLAAVLGKMSAALRSGEDRVAAARSTADALAAQDHSADLLSAAVAHALGGASATRASETARRYAVRPRSPGGQARAPR